MVQYRETKTLPDSVCETSYERASLLMSIVDPELELLVKIVDLEIHEPQAKFPICSHLDLLDARCSFLCSCEMFVVPVTPVTVGRLVPLDFRSKLPR